MVKKFKIEYMTRYEKPKMELVKLYLIEKIYETILESLTKRFVKSFQHSVVVLVTNLNNFSVGKGNADSTLFIRRLLTKEY